MTPSRSVGLSRSTSPNGNADVNLTNRWVTWETRNITWDTFGTIPFVKIEYSNDGFNQDIHEVEASVANTGSYPWIVDDAVLKVDNEYDNYNLVQIRISDVNDAVVYDDSDNTFRLTIIWSHGRFMTC